MSPLSAVTVAPPAGFAGESSTMEWSDGTHRAARRNHSLIHELRVELQSLHAIMESKYGELEARLDSLVGKGGGGARRRASLAASAAPTAELSLATSSRGYLLKDVDAFAGFAHAINTYLAGVALADRHDRQLIYQPFRTAHGMDYAIDDFLWSDPRGLVPPLAAPRLVAGGADSSAPPLVDGMPATYGELRKGSSAYHIGSYLNSSKRSVVWVRNGRFAFHDTCNCSYNGEVRYAALWLRERFWQAVSARRRSMQQVAASPSLARGGKGGGSKGGGSKDVTGGAGGAGAAAGSPGATAAEEEPISVSVHVRRGDVTYIDLKGRPSSRWVETSTVLEILRGVQQVLRRPLAPPAVHVHVHTEHGWLANDTAAVRALAPGAEVHTDASQPATLEALVRMASSDILLVGSSGFSQWAGILSCGLKIANPTSPPLPMRHVPFASSLTTRAQPFAAAALDDLRKQWTAYHSCKRRPTCRATLCGPHHISDRRWFASGLAQRAAADLAALQWAAPAWDAAAAAMGIGSAVGSAALAALDDNAGGGVVGLSDGIKLAELAPLYRACSPARGVRSQQALSKLLGCARSAWGKNLSNFLVSARKYRH